MLIRTLLLFLVTLLSLGTYATEREVVVLNSIAAGTTNNLIQLQLHEIARKIEKEFKNRFYFSGYKLVYRDGVDAEILSHYLNSPTTLALFWISHAAGQKTLGDGAITLDSIIQDSYGNDVKNLFQKINPHIQFLSIIGCEAKSILDNFVKSGYLHDDLVIHSYDKKIALHKGIKESIRESAKVIDRRGRLSYTYIKGNKKFNNVEAIPLQPMEGVRLTILNTNPSHSAQLMVGDNFIGLLNKGINLQSFTIPYHLIKKKTKLVVTYDKRSIKNQEYLNPLHIEDEDNTFEFDYLKDKNGNPYALNKNFYYLIQ